MRQIMITLNVFVHSVFTFTVNLSKVCDKTENDLKRCHHRMKYKNMCKVNRILSLTIIELRKRFQIFDKK